MTERDFAFWLQGFFELSAHPTEGHEGARADLIRRHADLALQTSPGSGFVLACKAVAGQPEALRAIVAAQFEHVIDQTLPPKSHDPAHGLGVNYRC